MSATTPTAVTKTCPKCGMAVPVKAYVCAYCKKRLRTGPVALGCAAVFALIVALTVVISNTTPSNPPAATGSSDPASWQGSPKRPSDAEVARKKTEDPAWLKKRAGKLWKKYHWAPDVCETVAGRQVQIGMSADQVREAWGRPESINTTVTGSSRHEQWVWGMYQYAYFDDGVLTSIQQSH